jgi:hypothetical protein
LWNSLKVDENLGSLSFFVCYKHLQSAKLAKVHFRVLGAFVFSRFIFKLGFRFQFFFILVVLRARKSVRWEMLGRTLLNTKVTYMLYETSLLLLQGYVLVLWIPCVPSYMRHMSEHELLRSG